METMGKNNREIIVLNCLFFKPDVSDERGNNFSSPFIKQEVSEETGQGILGNELFFRNLHFQQNENENINENFHNQDQNRNTATTLKNESLFVKILCSKFHLIVLFIFTYGFIILGDSNFSSYCIFLPLLWELTETIIIKPRDNSSEALICLVMIMIGVPTNIFQPILKLTHILKKIFKKLLY